MELKVSIHHTKEVLHVDLLKYFYELSDSFGRFIASDANLLHFPRNAVYVRQVLNNPDCIGLWFMKWCGTSFGRMEVLSCFIQSFVHHVQLKMLKSL